MLNVCLLLQDVTSVQGKEHQINGVTLAVQPCPYQDLVNHIQVSILISCHRGHRVPTRQELHVKNVSLACNVIYNSRHSSIVGTG